MNKTFRFLLVIALLGGVIAVAGGTAVWASPTTKAPEAVSAKADPALPATYSSVGTVLPEGCQGESVKDGEVKGICGVAVVTAPMGSKVYASPTGPGTITLFFERGSVEICFAAPINGVIHFQPPNNENDWFHMATNIVNGRACALVSANGHYTFHE